MSEALKIAIIGDYNFTYNSHHATNLSLDHAAEFLEIELNYYWIKVNEALQQKNALASAVIDGEGIDAQGGIAMSIGSLKQFLASAIV